jgi:hypothetical protein
LQPVRALVPSPIDGGENIFSPSRWRSALASGAHYPAADIRVMHDTG